VKIYIEKVYIIMGKKKRKNKNLAPRRKRMNRSGRLQSGKEWIKTFEGKNILKSYAKWYGVNNYCAMIELEMLGVKFSEKKKQQIQQSEADKVREQQLRKARRKQKERLEDFDYDSDETFAFIAGYTEGGIPFGITYDDILDEGDVELSFLVPNGGEDDVEDWIEFLLFKNESSSIKWENDHWYSETFDWEHYFGHQQAFHNQDELVYQLNRLNLLEQFQESRLNRELSTERLGKRSGQELTLS